MKLFNNRKADEEKVGIDKHTTMDETIKIMLENNYSRYPVFDDDLDNIVGILYFKDFVKAYLKDKNQTIEQIMVEPLFVHPTKNISELFKRMQKEKIHMVIVVDEYGQTEGIIAMEDILEEIVGNIFDEYDESRDTFRTQVDNSIIIDGLASLDDVEQELDIEFGDVEMETLNGYLTELLGHIPSREDLDKEIVANGYRFKILSLGNRTIGRVRAEKINDKETKGESEKCQDIQNSQT